MVSSTVFGSACPHDCPSTCALEVEVNEALSITRVRGAADNSYTAGVICSKVARYSERLYHPDRLTVPLRRSGSKGSGRFEPISWDNALDEVAEAFITAEQRHGAEAVWPYLYAGTMGLVMRDGINRLRHAKGYSRFYPSICTRISTSGYIAGAGRVSGADPREMAESDLIVIWGTNAASTQVNVMTHALRARRQRGARIVVIDVYENATAKQADLFLCLRPGTDGALACALMHILFRDNTADRTYMAEYTDCPSELETHLQSRGPAWASRITGLPEEQIERLAQWIGHTPRCFLRLGYGFTRQRNGAVNMHAALSVAAVAGSWRHRGGGAFHSNSGIYHWDKSLIEGLDMLDPSVRLLDQCRLGPILCGDREALEDGPPVTAMLVQNTNPLCVLPDQTELRRGFSRQDLFVCVHEQFMTETTDYADIILPATMFLEHDDVYQGGGHQHIIFGPKIVDPPGECRSNHEVICGLAERLGAEHRGFELSSREIIDESLRMSGYPELAVLESNRWLDCQPDFEEAHFLTGFKNDDGRFRFAANWDGLEPRQMRAKERFNELPRLPDHWEGNEDPDERFPFSLVTAPARNFLNSSFNEVPTSRRREHGPVLRMHSADAAAIEAMDGAQVEVESERGSIRMTLRVFDGLQRGVVVAEGIWPHSKFHENRGINYLTGSDRVAPIGGVAFHDNRVSIRKSPQS